MKSPTLGFGAWRSHGLLCVHMCLRMLAQGVHTCACGHVHCVPRPVGHVYTCIRVPGLPCTCPRVRTYPPVHALPCRGLTPPRMLRGIPAIPGTGLGQLWENGSFWKGWRMFPFMVASGGCCSRLVSTRRYILAACRAVTKHARGWADHRELQRGRAGPGAALAGRCTVSDKGVKTSQNSQPVLCRLLPPPSLLSSCLSYGGSVAL